MTPEQVLKTLVNDGCAILIGIGGTLLLPVAVAEIHGSELRWCTMFPEDQHHTHVTQFIGKPEVFRDRAILFRLDDPKFMRAYIAPADEWPEPYRSEIKAKHAAWLRFLSDPENRANFQAFVRQELGIVADTASEQGTWTIYLNVAKDHVLVRVPAYGEGIVGDLVRHVGERESFFGIPYERLVEMGDGAHAVQFEE